MEHIVSIDEVISYNRNMPSEFAKKSKQILVNVDQVVFGIVSKIAKDEDRPAGYVARELMIRGLALYERDGKLRESEPSVNGKLLAKQSLHKIPIKKEKPAHKKVA